MNGLEKGESCVSFTSDEHDHIEKRLSSEGIGIDRFKKYGQLRIYLVRAPSDVEPIDLLSILKGIRADATNGMKGPYRFAGRTIPDNESENGMLTGTNVERTGLRHFQEFDNSQMCFCDISNLKKTRRNEWISALVKNHDHVICASSPDKAVAFDATLLEKEEE